MPDRRGVLDRRRRSRLGRSAGLRRAQRRPRARAHRAGPAAGRRRRPGGARPAGRLDSGGRRSRSRRRCRRPSSRPALLDAVRAAYAPGAGMVDAFGRWLESWLGPRGLVVFDSSDPAAKPLVASLFAREIEHAGETSRLAAAAGAGSTARGYHAQVDAAGGSARRSFTSTARASRSASAIGGCDRRRASRPRGAARSACRRTRPSSAPTCCCGRSCRTRCFPRSVTSPDRTSWPTSAQLRGIYEAFGVPMPLMQQRASATLLDSNAMRFLTRHDLPLESLRAAGRVGAERAAQGADPGRRRERRSTRPARDAGRADGRAGRGRWRRSTRRSRARRDRRSAACRTTSRSCRARSSRRPSGRTRRCAGSSSTRRRRRFPGGQPQEREIGFVYFLNKYGAGAGRSAERGTAARPGAALGDDDLTAAPTHGAASDGRRRPPSGRPLGAVRCCTPPRSFAILARGTLTYYYVSFSRLIDARLHGERERTLPRVYARPIVLRQGQAIGAAGADRPPQRSRLRAARRRRSARRIRHRRATPSRSCRGRPTSAAGRSASSFPARRRAPSRASRWSAAAGPTTVQLDAPLLTALMTSGGREKRRSVPLATIPKYVQQAVLAIEDQGFYSHPGINPFRLVAAALTNVFGDNQNLVGYSTITQQLARMFFLADEFNAELTAGAAVLRPQDARDADVARPRAARVEGRDPRAVSQRRLPRPARVVRDPRRRRGGAPLLRQGRRQPEPAARRR